MRRESVSRGEHDKADVNTCLATSCLGGNCSCDISSQGYHIRQLELIIAHIVVPMSADVSPQVEHIIREDYMVEAMEVVELYCDLLLARFGMLELMR